MKKVFNNRELAHVWAGQKQQEGRGSSMFFDGPSIFSYGRHFEIARIVRAGVKGGAPIVLFNSASYSKSTTKHKSHVARACSHADVFTVASMTDHSANARDYLAEIETARGKALRAVKNAVFYRNESACRAEIMARYLETFKKEIPVKLRAEVCRVASLVKAGKLFTIAELSKIAASDARRVAADKAATERRERSRQEWEDGAPAREMNKAHEEAAREELRRETPALLERWAQGADVETDGLYLAGYFTPTRLRVKGERVETSRGAQITERKARELWAALVRGADVSGVELDNYTVSSWDGLTLRVGCHDIARVEIERMAAVLGLPGALPVVAAEVR